MTNNNGGPWGGGGRNSEGGDGDNTGGPRGPRRPGEGAQIPEIDEIVRKGQEQLRVLMGGRRGGGGGTGGGGGGGPTGPQFTRGTVALVALAAAGLWAFASFYTVKPEERSVELFLGKFSDVGNPGLNFAPWPLVTKEVISTTRERVESIGGGGPVIRGGRQDAVLMLTGDENIVDIDFQVVWNINDPAKFLFSLRDPVETMQAVAESAMREIIAQSELAPILNRDRGIIAIRLQEMVQTNLDSYNSGMNVVRINLDRADPPAEVINSFREVQAAEQERDRLQKTADAYANRILAGARGEAAQIQEEAEGYRARVVNEAEGDASRFLAVLSEYDKAPDVTRRRLYIETMEEVLSGVDKILLDQSSGDGTSNGIVPYLPLNELRRGGTQQ